jgi:hypothetical protein
MVDPVEIDNEERNQNSSRNEDDDDNPASPAGGEGGNIPLFAGDAEFRCLETYCTHRSAAESVIKAHP